MSNGVDFKKIALENQDLLNAALAREAALREELDNHDCATLLINTWVDAHGKQIPWDKAIEIIAVATKMPDAEKTRLLCLDDQYELLQQRLTVAEQRAGELERLIDSGAARDVLGERRRQIMEEHRLLSDDDDYTLGQLAWAASGYAAGSTPSHQAGGTLQPTNWPWAPRWWKPGTPRQMLIKSGALILAEIERIDRAALKPAEEPKYICDGCGSNGWTGNCEKCIPY